MITKNFVDFGYVTGKKIPWKTLHWITNPIIGFILIQYGITTYFSTRVVPKVMSNFVFHANWEQQTKKSAVVDGTSCCVILECLVTSIACITWLVSLLTKWPTTIFHFASVLSSNSLWKRKSLLQKFTRDFSVLMEVCAWVRAVFEDGWNILKMGKRRQFRKHCVSVFGWLERSSTAGEFSNFQNAGRNVYKEVAIMWKNTESYVD